MEIVSDSLPCKIKFATVVTFTIKYRAMAQQQANNFCVGTRGKLEQVVYLYASCGLLCLLNCNRN